MISMKEIGRICGISESTVSKALRGNPAIRPATAERVMAVARKYGYQPNAMVECMQTGRSRSIGIAFNNFGCQFAGAVMEGIHQILHERDYDSYVISWDKLVKDHVELLSRFARRRVDGLLLFPPEAAPPAERLEELRNFHNPIVAIDQAWAGYELDYVGCDNRRGMFELVEHLIHCGYRRIGAICFSHVSTGEERKRGFLDAMFKHNLPVSARDLADLGDYRNEAYGAARELLASADRPEALVCFNDYIANDALNAAFDLGIRVPEELAITGFGNLPLAEKLRPRLTTVDQFACESGKQAARLLLDRISGAETGPRREIIVAPELVIRDSVRPEYLQRNAV